MTTLEVLIELRRVLDEVPSDKFKMGIWWDKKTECGCIVGHAHHKSDKIRDLHLLCYLGSMSEMVSDVDATNTALGVYRTVVDFIPYYTLGIIPTPKFCKRVLDLAIEHAKAVDPPPWNTSEIIRRVREEVLN